MSTNQTTTSAALYFSTDRLDHIPLAWFEGARRFFEDRNLPLTYFYASGASFQVDEFHDFAGRSADLAEGLQGNRVRGLCLHSPRTYSGPKSDWRATAFIWLTDGIFYLGVDEQVVPSPSTLLARAWEVARDILDVRYGISYKLPLSKHPDLYATGSNVFSLAKLRELLEARKKGAVQKHPNEIWSDELNNKKRHLTSHFRGVFPASIVSETHVQAADLRTHGIGRLTELDRSLWLWELSDAEMPAAESVLREKRVLVTGKERW